MGLHLPAPHPSPQLVQLRKSEALGIFHHHYHGIGDVHPDLHHGGGHQ